MFCEETLNSLTAAWQVTYVHKFTVYCGQRPGEPFNSSPAL